MSWLKYLALALELWTVLGLIGLTISVVRRERRKLREGICALVGVWLVYLIALGVTSYRQPEEHVPMGNPVCFDALCLAVVRVDEIPEFPKKNNMRLERVTIRVTNRGKTEAGEQVTAYLLDAQGRRWEPSNAVSGNPLHDRVLAKATIMSEPVFRVAQDATGLKMILTHGRWSQHRLVIGDPESLGHRKRVMMLDR